MRGLSRHASAYATTPVVVFLTLAVIAIGCGDRVEPPSGEPVSIVELTHADPTCAGDGDAHFVAHDLDHLTSGPGDTASTFDGTGAGIAAGDLDGDGDDDLVLPNLSGATSILENTGDPAVWITHELITGRFRGAAVIDLGADGLRDIVLTTGIGPPVLFTNTGQGPLDERFERGQLDGVRAATYAMAWSDLSGDGDLDLVTGSYNAELTLLRNSPVLGNDTGVILYEAGPDGYTVTRLSPDAQALAMTLADLNGDDRLEIIVGNDLATADFVFTDIEIGWERVTPFETTSYSTMSYDSADLDGDGTPELFTTDMAPMADANLDDYREVFEDLEAAPRPDNIQTPENVLLRLDGNDWVNEGRDLGVDATGWSWSGLFGDLDNDGHQDLFVVNGMRSDLLFDFLPEARLVEANQVFRNPGDAGESFLPMPEWGLADTTGGRGVVQFDADRDGDLDIAINNLDAPSRLFENRTCDGSALTVELRWPDSQNLDALAAEVETVDGDRRQTRVVSSARGYLSGASPAVHFGTADADDVDLVVRWPDGAVSTIPGVATGNHLIITRTHQTSE